MLNDTYAVTDYNVLHVNTYHKIRASSVGRASAFLKTPRRRFTTPWFFFVVVVVVDVVVVVVVVVSFLLLLSF